jgi:hypothetical protein
MYAVMDTKRVTNNEETLKQRQQAVERKRPYRARKRQQQNTTRVMCYTVSDEQLTASPHYTKTALKHFMLQCFWS